MKYIIIFLAMLLLACQENHQNNNSDLEDNEIAMTGDAFYIESEIMSDNSELDFLDEPIEETASEDVFVSELENYLDALNDTDLFSVLPDTSL
tara:strand:+ start:1475 stop:1753 length:279 start_codon:yes stop_codon:yes gene_type:complete